MANPKHTGAGDSVEIPVYCSGNVVGRLQLDLSALRKAVHEYLASPDADSFAALEVHQQAQIRQRALRLLERVLELLADASLGLIDSLLGDAVWRECLRPLPKPSSPGLTYEAVLRQGWFQDLVIHALDTGDNGLLQRLLRVLKSDSRIRRGRKPRMWPPHLREKFRDTKAQMVAAVREIRGVHNPATAWSKVRPTPIGQRIEAVGLHTLFFFQLRLSKELPVEQMAARLLALEHGRSISGLLRYVKSRKSVNK